MNFTREPIIETIVSPKDGYKLCVRNSKIAGSEEFFVDAVEIVSFGHSFFYRGLERPKPFLVPVSDYELFEVKETRVILKNIAHDRNIKIGGGREASLRPAKEAPVEKKEEEVEEEVKEVVVAAPGDAPVDPKNDRKRDRRRSRRRRLAEEKKDWVEKDKPEGEESASSEEKPEGASVEEVKVPSMIFTHLLPPPSILISERISKMREKEAAEAAALAALQKTEENESPVLEEKNPLETHSETALEHNDDHFPI